MLSGNFSFSRWEMYMRHEPEPHVLLFKVSLISYKDNSRVTSPPPTRVADYITPTSCSLLSSFPQREKDYDQKHPPLTERRVQPQLQQRQTASQTSS
jgi:hypothetical protein